ncbi:unnamed protein product [Phytophthora fragariaefolia]|uniref:Unnamed protein product n=1 Tax=Phytophthora fragariaefolia TaxID=1490495 RepID=A0A9W7D5J9_9STRA|nr:unnamed protein product [Phytophthora fragariaefolia]
MQEMQYPYRPRRCPTTALVVAQLATTCSDFIITYSVVIPHAPAIAHVVTAILAILQCISVVLDFLKPPSERKPRCLFGDEVSLFVVQFTSTSSTDASESIYKPAAASAVSLASSWSCSSPKERSNALVTAAWDSSTSLSLDGQNIPSTVFCERTILISIWERRTTSSYSNNMTGLEEAPIWRHARQLRDGRTNCTANSTRITSFSAKACMPATPRSSNYKIQQKRVALMLASDIGTKPATDFLGYPSMSTDSFRDCC